MGRHKLKESERSVPFTFNLTPAYLQHLKNLCYEMSYREKKDYNLSYLIRETLMQVYPPPKDMQVNMFGDK